MRSWGRASQAEGTDSAKALWWECLGGRELGTGRGDDVRAEIRQTGREIKVTPGQ